MHELNRRRFLITTSALALAGAWPRTRAACGQTEMEDKPKEAPGALPMIELGDTGRTVPRLGFGAAPIGRLDSDDEGVAVLRRAFDVGIRYLDVAPSYSRGLAEKRIGLALEGFKRADFFIATKTLERSGDAARKDLEASLKRLNTDHVDLIQVHEVHDDLDRVFAKGAVLEALLRAREEKLIRHIGFTVHRNPKYAIEMVKRHPFATALVPVNPLDVKHLSFVRGFLPVAKERGVPVIAMKVFAGGPLLKANGGPFTAAECLHYALSQEAVAVAVPGCETISHVDEARAAAADFAPLSKEECAALEARAGEHKGKKSEWYKEVG